MAANGWSAVSADFSGANTAMANSLRAANSVSATVTSMQDKLAKAAADKENKRRYEETKTENDRRYQDTKTRQEKADDIANYMAGGTGYGQGDKVAAVMNGITSRTNRLDDTATMNEMNVLYDKIPQDKLITESNTILDAEYNKLDDQTKEFMATNQGESDRFAEIVLGDKYGAYVAAQSKTGELEKYNANAANNYESLYKTTDANAIVSTLTDELVKGGVNRIYAAKVAKEKASQYLDTTRKETEIDKERMKMLDARAKILSKLTQSTSSTNSNTKGSSKNGENGSKFVQSLKSMQQGPADAEGMLKSLSGVAENLEIGNYVTTFKDGENKDVKTSYVKEALKPIQVTIPVIENGKLVKGKSRTVTVYPSQKDAANALINVASSNVTGGSTAEGLAEFKTALKKAAQTSAVYGLTHKSKGNGKNSSTTSSTQTSKTYNKDVRNQLDAILLEQNAILNKYAAPSAKDKAYKILGITKPKKVSKVTSKKTKETKKPGTGTGKKGGTESTVVETKAPDPLKESKSIDVGGNVTSTIIESLGGRTGYKPSKDQKGKTITNLRAALGIKVPKKLMKAKATSRTETAQEFVDRLTNSQNARQVGLNSGKKVAVPTRLRLPILNGATSNGTKKLPSEFLRLGK